MRSYTTVLKAQTKLHRSIFSSANAKPIRDLLAHNSQREQSTLDLEMVITVQCDFKLMPLCGTHDDKHWIQYTQTY